MLHCTDLRDSTNRALPNLTAFATSTTRTHGRACRICCALARYSGSRSLCERREGLRAIPSNAFFHGFFGASTNSSTPDECSVQCANSDSCVAYEWNADEPRGTCTELDFRTYIETFRNPIPGASSGRCGTQLPTTNGDFAGNDLKNTPARNVVECSFQCEDTPGCHAYSWSAYDGGKCWMKTTRTAVLSGPFDGSVVSGEPFKCSAAGWGYDTTGGDIGSVARADWRDCCGVCRRTAGCVASAWSDYNGGTCWLKNAITDYAQVSGVITMRLK